MQKFICYIYFKIYFLRKIFFPFFFSHPPLFLNSFIRLTLYCMLFFSFRKGKKYILILLNCGENKEKKNIFALLNFPTKLWILRFVTYFAKFSLSIWTSVTHMIAHSDKNKTIYFPNYILLSIFEFLLTKIKIKLSYDLTIFHNFMFM